MIPGEITLDCLNGLRLRVNCALAAAGIELVDIASSIIVERRFNALLRREGNKSGVLTGVTLQLVHHLICQHPHELIDVVCDRHGGRHHYAAALQACVGSEPVLARCEDRHSSRYQIGVSDHSPQIQFLVRSESLLATALASMTAKYVRELAMREFNDFWCGQVPGLRRTAGYPVDARRFRRDVSDKQRALGISDGILWRRR
jgi:hypothetical protein